MQLIRQNSVIDKQVSAPTPAGIEQIRGFDHWNIPPGVRLIALQREIRTPNRNMRNSKPPNPNLTFPDVVSKVFSILCPSMHNRHGLEAVTELSREPPTPEKVEKPMTPRN